MKNWNHTHTYTQSTPYIGAMHEGAEPILTFVWHVKRIKNGRNTNYTGTQNNMTSRYLRNISESPESIFAVRSVYGIDACVNYRLDYKFQQMILWIVIYHMILGRGFQNTMGPPSQYHMVNHDSQYHLLKYIIQSVIYTLVYTAHWSNCNMHSELYDIFLRYRDVTFFELLCLFLDDIL
jgi:hypothetical protein